MAETATEVPLRKQQTQTWFIMSQLKINSASFTRLGQDEMLDDTKRSKKYQKVAQSGNNFCSYKC